MHYDRNFYKDEVREGFYVSGMMKRCWAAQMDVMHTVIDICLSDDIKVFVDYGTLLGAIRHNGFIPWDDDLDIMVFRKDLDLLLKELRDRLPDEWKLLESQDESYLEPWYRIWNSRINPVKTERLGKCHGFPYPAGIDIFILDYLPPTQLERDLLNTIYEFIRFADIESEGEDVADVETRLSLIEEVLNIKIKRGELKEVKSTLISIAHALAASYTDADSNVLTKTDGRGYGVVKYKPEWFEEMIWMPFENTFVPVPSHYNEVLTAEYGNYMISQMGGGSHDYPFFKDSEKICAQITGIDMIYETEKEHVLKHSARKVEKDNKVIFFLPSDPISWKYMEFEWKKLKKNPKNQVYVMPVPHFEKDEFGNTGEMIYDVSGYPDYVDVTRLEEINIEAFDIDEIYIDQPYDDRNMSFTVHPYFYSSHLREMCRCLIYIPPFSLTDFDSTENVSFATFDYFVRMPGVVYSDRIVLGSKVIRERYLDYLCIWMDDETREFWNSKLSVENSVLTNQCNNSDSLVSLNQKKKLLFQVDAAFFIENGERAYKKIINALQIIKKSGEQIRCVFSMHETIAQLIENDNEVGELCRKLMEMIRTDTNILLDSNKSSDINIDEIDAYYGTAGCLAHRCSVAGIPVMIMSAEC